MALHNSSPVWSATKEADALTLHAPAAYRSWLKGQADGPFDVIIKPHQDQRSLDQNAYLHGEPFPKLAEHFSCSVEQVKHDLMGECFGWVESKITPGRLVPFMPRTSQMTVKQCTFFIDWLIPWALVEHGVEIFLPDEWQLCSRRK